MAIIDVFTFNGEYDLLEIRLNMLDRYVDEFVIVEATETFTGKPKKLYYEKEKARYKKWESKIRYHVIELPYKEEYVAMAHGSPNTRGATHWKTEFCQKESIKDALTHLKDKDIVFIGDVDEIWNPEIMSNVYTEGCCILGGTKLLLRVYTYYLNNASSEVFHGTYVSYYKDIKNECLNHLRSSTQTRTASYCGWHFTSMGGYEEVKRKLDDSYTADSYNTPVVQVFLKDNIEESKDFLGRPFTYSVDESNWPQWLKDNKSKYTHLCKNN